MIKAFIFFFAVIDPIGTIPVFIAVTSGNSRELKKKIAIKAFVVSAIILGVFIIAGEYVLNGLNIPLSAFQIAGGIVLFLFALSMIFGESKPESELKMVSSSTEKAIYPLAIPSIASPGAMLAAVLLTENASNSWQDQGLVAIAMMAVLVITLVGMFLATALSRLIGESGASIISRVMGLILASVAVNNVLRGINLYFEII